MNNLNTRKIRYSGAHKFKAPKQPKLNYDLRDLINSASSQLETIESGQWKYEDLSIDPGLRANILLKGYTFPTPIQEQSIQHLLDGRDIIGIAGTGTGKTAAFLIPIIQNIIENAESKSLVILPTRELALQVERELNSLVKGMNIKSACLIGGQNLSMDRKKLRHPNHIVIGTPGRLLDLQKQGLLKLGNISTLVLDEFDRMLDMGFIKDINHLINMMSSRNQTMFFSATLDPKQQNHIDRILDNPVKVNISNGHTGSNNVIQKIIEVPNGMDKFEILKDLIQCKEFTKVMLFIETKRKVDRIGRKLSKLGVSCSIIHGDKSQSFRNSSLKKFEKGHTKVLVATDVASRGIHVSNVTHVINYEMPRTRDSYIHRIGRTGRAGKQGLAYTLLDSNTY